MTSKRSFKPMDLLGGDRAPFNKAKTPELALRMKQELTNMPMERECSRQMCQVSKYRQYIRPWMPTHSQPNRMVSANPSFLSFYGHSDNGFLAIGHILTCYLGGDLRNGRNMSSQHLSLLISWFFSHFFSCDFHYIIYKKLKVLQVTKQWIVKWGQQVRVLVIILAFVDNTFLAMNSHYHANLLRPIQVPFDSSGEAKWSEWWRSQ